MLQWVQVLSAELRLQVLPVLAGPAAVLELPECFPGHFSAVQALAAARKHLERVFLLPQHPVFLRYQSSLYS